MIWTGMVGEKKSIKSLTLRANNSFLAKSASSFPASHPPYLFVKAREEHKKGGDIYGTPSLSSLSPGEGR